MTDTAAIKVYVVDDEEAHRNSLVSLVEAVKLKACAYASPSQFLTDYADQNPACLLMDIRMPDLSGMAAYKEIIQTGHSIPVIFITAYIDVRMAVRAMKLGAFDIFEKPFNEQELLDAVQSAIAEHANRLAALKDSEITFKKWNRLTERQQQVVELVVQGMTNKEIAKALLLSPKTVETHRASAMEKLGIERAADLVRFGANSLASQGKP